MKTGSFMRIAMMRCITTACIVTVAVVVGYIWFGKPIDPNVTWLVGTLLGSGFGGKAIQKKFEADGKPVSENNKKN